MGLNLEEQVFLMSVSDFKSETNIVDLVKDDILKRKPHRYETELKNIDIYIEQAYKKYKESKKFRTYYNRKLILLASTKKNFVSKPMPASVREKLKRKLESKITNSTVSVTETNLKSNFDGKNCKVSNENNGNQESLTSLLVTPVKHLSKPNTMNKSSQINLSENEIIWNQSYSKNSSCGDMGNLEAFKFTNSNKQPETLKSDTSKDPCVSLTETNFNLPNDAKNKSTLTNLEFLKAFKTSCLKIPLSQTSMLRLIIQPVLQTISFKEFIDMVIFPKSLAKSSSLLNKLREYYEDKFYLKNNWPEELRVKIIKLKKFIQNELCLKAFNLFDIPTQFFTIEDLKKYTNFVEILEELDVDITLDFYKQTLCYDWLVHNGCWMPNMKFNDDFFKNDAEKTSILPEISIDPNDVSLLSLKDFKNPCQVKFKLDWITFDDFVKYSNIFNLVRESLMKRCPGEKLNTDVIKKHCTYYYRKLISETSFPDAITFSAKYIFTMMPKALNRQFSKTDSNTCYLNNTSEKTPCELNSRIDTIPIIQLQEVFGYTTKPIQTQELNNVSFLSNEGAFKNMYTEEHKNSSTLKENNNGKEANDKNVTSIQIGCSSIQIKEEPKWSQHGSDGSSDVIFVPISPEKQIVIDDSEVTATDLLKEMFEFGASQSFCFDFSNH